MKRLVRAGRDFVNSSATSVPERSGTTTSERSKSIFPLFSAISMASFPEVASDAR